MSSPYLPFSSQAISRGPCPTQKGQGPQSVLGVVPDGDDVSLQCVGLCECEVQGVVEHEPTRDSVAGCKSVAAVVLTTGADCGRSDVSGDVAVGEDRRT